MNIFAAADNERVAVLSLCEKVRLYIYRSELGLQLANPNIFVERRLIKGLFVLVDCDCQLIMMDNSDILPFQNISKNHFLTSFV